MILKGVRALNDLAKRVVQRTPGATFLDLAAMRSGSPFDGDGHHCVKNYFKQQGDKTYGASCLWRMRGLVTVLSSMLKE